MTGLATTVRVLRGEGALAVRDRALDRLAEARRRRSFTARRSAPAGFRAEELNLIGSPPSPWLGGVQTQLLRRLEAEARERSTALLYPDRGGYRLELTAGSERTALLYLRPWSRDLTALEDPVLEEAAIGGVDASGAERLHVEGLAGLPLGSLLTLARRGLRLTLALHDFAPFCPRPHLLEVPPLAFCHYSRDSLRCARCLQEDWQVEVGWQEGRRALAAELLAAAETITYPSAFLRSTYLDLFPSLPRERQQVVKPVMAFAGVPERHVPLVPPRHVAFVGSVLPHKGALVFEEVVRRLAGATDLRWSVYGGGDAAILAHLRRLPRVRVRGYYRSGSLPRLLARDRVDLALLLSIVPESYGFTLSECHAAGVPVAAYDLGALGERIRAEGSGHLLPLAAGAEGVAALLENLLAPG
ncbi:MAG TPA: glycosyltransferase [Thermoanaerobaculia bacterium]|nr:glycosyltransferase [Thermoanaerobaculia bacterium]